MKGEIAVILDVNGKCASVSVPLKGEPREITGYEMVSHVSELPVKCQQ